MGKLVVRSLFLLVLTGLVAQPVRSQTDAGNGLFNGGAEDVPESIPPEDATPF